MIDTALILAGGVGSRLGELTSKTPKPLLKVGGKPFIFHLIDDLVAQNVKNIYISTGYLSEMFDAILPEGNWHQCNVTTIREQERLGTGGAVSYFLKHKVPQEGLLVLNGDTFIFNRDFDFSKHKNKENWVLTTKVDDASESGFIEVDTAYNVVEFREKTRSGSGLINAGTYFFSDAVSLQIDMKKFGDHFSLEDFLSSYVKEVTFKAMCTYGKMIDMGKPNTLTLMREEFEK